MDPFWYNQPLILIQSNRLTEFFPNKMYSVNENLNTIVRLCLYISIVFIMYTKDIIWSSIFILALIITWYIYIHKEDINITDKPSTIENFESKVDYDASIENDKIPPSASVKNNSNCSKPSVNNPFMNTTMDDYLNTDKSGNIKIKQEACDINNAEIKKAIDQNFKNNLFKDVNDVFGRYNSQRQFFTMPSTDIIPDSNGDFKNWLYNSPKTCKEDQDYCLQYEDIRAKRPDINTILMEYK